MIENALRQHPAIRLLDVMLSKMETKKRRKSVRWPVSKKGDYLAARWERNKLAMWKFQGRINNYGYLTASNTSRALGSIDVQRAFPHLKSHEAAEVAARLIRKT